MTSDPRVAPLLPAPLYQGAVNTWECDEGGHLNVRFQLERCMIGLAHFAAALDMPRAFAADAGATLLPLDLHVRFLKEARPGEALAMQGGVLSCGETDAHLCFDLRHADGAPGAVFNLKVSHADARTMRPFPWSARSRAAAGRLTCAAPAHAAARSVDATKAGADIGLARAKEIGLARTGAFFVTPDQCDAFGRMRAEFVFGRVSDAVPTLLGAWRRDAVAATRAAGAAPIQAAGAVVEARVLFRRWPRPGDLIEVHSGLAETGAKTNRLVHWLLDPVSGAPWASLEAVALTFDVATRKSITYPPAVQEALAKRVIPGLAI